MQKSLLVEQAFRIWSVIEDYSPLRGSPCGPLLAQRSLASLESNLPAPGGSHPHELQMQKSLLVEQAFRIWSVIEDYSPLRGSPCGPLLAQRSLASLESNLPAPGGSHPHELQMQKSLLVEQAFRIWSVIEDYSPLRGSPCGPLLAQRSLASLESNLPAPGGSHPHELQMQKSLLVEQAFRIWSVIEDYSPLRGSPCGPLLAQRSLASLESNLPAPGGSHPHELQMQKSLLVEQAFRIWSVIEDSNLRPLRPERSALPGCANHRMRGASYCADTPSSIP